MKKNKKYELVVGWYKGSIVCLRSSLYDSSNASSWHWASIDASIEGFKFGGGLINNSEVLVFSNRCRDRAEAMLMYGRVKFKEE